MELNDKHIRIIGIGDGCSKLVEDFCFIFSDKLNIVSTAEYFNDVKNLRFDTRNKTDYLVCCTYDHSNAAKCLKSFGLVHKKDYCFAYDLFPLLDDWKHSKIAFIAYPGTIKERLKSVLFGYAAKHGKILYEDKHKDVLKGRYPDSLSSSDNGIIQRIVYAIYLIPGLLEALPQIWARKDHYEKYDRICFYNISDAIRYRKEHPSVSNKVITVEELKAHSMASLYMKATYFDRRQNDCACEIPHNTLWVGKSGTTRLCDCPDFLNISCGNIGVTDTSSVWDSPLARIIRLSVINNTYTFCSRETCGKLTGNKDQTALLERRDPTAPDHPLNLNFASDYACNLHCPSCRKNIYSKNDENSELELIACIDDLTEAGWLDNAHRLFVGGGGEVFLSQNYKRVLYEAGVKRKSVVIMTNGTLFTSKEWEKLEGKYEDISFMVSVDAATKETYEKVRCGGQFERLMENMRFLSMLRKENKVNNVKVIMIVQKANYMEIPDFIKWAKGMGFDKVNLSHIRNWGTFNDKYFYENVSMFDKNGKMLPELSAVLENPVCKDPIVSMSWQKSVDGQGRG